VETLGWVAEGVMDYSDLFGCNVAIVSRFHYWLICVRRLALSMDS
jgi:hypothetical protein